MMMLFILIIIEWLFVRRDRNDKTSEILGFFFIFSALIWICYVKQNTKVIDNQKKTRGAQFSKNLQPQTLCEPADE